MRKIKNILQKISNKSHSGRVYLDPSDARKQVKDYTQEQKNEIMNKFFGQLKDAGMYRLDDEDEIKAEVN